MAQCTELERRLLDAMMSNEGRGRQIHELCAELALSKVTPELREALISATAHKIQACNRIDELWDEVNALGFRGGESVSYNDFWNNIYDEAKKRI